MRAAAACACVWVLALAAGGALHSSHNLGTDDDHAWAVQLSTSDAEVAMRVAEDIGMERMERIFDNVFLFREKRSSLLARKPCTEKLNHQLILWSERQTGRRRSSSSDRREVRTSEQIEKELNNQENLRNFKNIHHNQQRMDAGGLDHRSQKLSDPEKLGNIKNNYERQQKWGVSQQHRKRVHNEEKLRNLKTTHHHRARRAIGGLDRKPPKSPWTLLKTEDPLRWRQWYLDGGDGMHLNVTGLWEAGVMGAGVSVAILDDGVELTHRDLALNYDPAASWDLLDSDPDPTPVSWSRHGTHLAGIISAAHCNGMCGMGVAPWTGVGAVRMLGYMVWDVTEAAALSYERDHVDVYVAAWGPVDSGAAMEGPGVLAGKAMREGIVLGRGGRGSIYVWASGNGGLVGDDCNADGYANSLYTLTVSGSTHGGRPPNYAESCAATFVSTYSGDAEEEEEEEVSEKDQVNGIVTTDTGGDCSETFRGSSVSAAMVAGVCALALSVNSELGWRDMQHLMVLSATPHNPLPSQWSTNGVGLNYSYFFGFGSLDAGRLVEKAHSWQIVPPAFRCYIHASHHNITLVPDKPLVVPLSVSTCQIVQLEHVQLNLSVSARNRGHVEVMLESPSGTLSKLLPRRPLDLSPYGIHNHPLLTVHMWGEDPRGIWKLHITYYGEGILGPYGSKRLINTTNTLHNWTLILHGTEVPIKQASLHHYHHNSTQLSDIQERMRNKSNTQESRTAKITDEYRDDGLRIEIQYWNSKLDSGNMFLSYLFCRVCNANMSTLGRLSWHTGDGKPVEGVVSRKRHRATHSSMDTVLLLVRKVTIFTGNFTCTVLHNGEIVSRNVEIKNYYSSIPRETETTQVTVLGGNVTLPCNILSPIVRGTWSFKDERLRSDGRIVVSQDHLTLNNVNKDDLGIYKCVVTSSKVHLSHTASITLLLAAGPATLITHYNLDQSPPVPQLPQTTPKEKPCTADDSTTPKTPATADHSTTPATADHSTTPATADHSTTPATADHSMTPAPTSDTAEDSITPVTTSLTPGTDTSTPSLAPTKAERSTRHCPPPYMRVEGRCLLVSAGQGRSWQRSRSHCLRMGGDLLTVNNVTFMLALIKHLHTQGVGGGSFWVGGVRRGAGEWAWVGGNTLRTHSLLWFPTPRGRPHEAPLSRTHHTPRRNRSVSFKKSSFTQYQRRRKGASAFSSPGQQRNTTSLAPEHRTRSKQRTRQAPFAPEQATRSKQQTKQASFAPEQATRSKQQRKRASHTSEQTKRSKQRTKQASFAPGQTTNSKEQRKRASLHPDEATGSTNPSLLKGHRRRAVCLLAKFRHFFASCSVAERLTALCEMKRRIRV